MMTMCTHPDQVLIKIEETSGDELQEDSSSSEEEEEEEPHEEERDEIAKIDENESSTSYSSSLTTMDWHPEYQEDYWIRDSGASSHMVGEDKDLLGKTPIQGKANAANGTSMPMVCKGKMNVEAILKQGKPSKGVLTVKVAKGMVHKPLALQQPLCMIGRCMGQRKKMVILKSNSLINTLSQLCLIES